MDSDIVERAAGVAIDWGEGMTTIEREFGGMWRNEHRSLMKFYRREAAIVEEGGADVVAVMRRRRTVLGALIADEAAKDRELCVTGSGWSQSDLYHNLSTHLKTDRDEGIWELPEEAFLPGVEGRHRYLLVTGGTKIHRLMEHLHEAGRDLSLRTAGSHKGQSLAGLVGTGSHGSTMAESGAETHVRGMVLSTGREEAVWLADPEKPVLREEWVAQFASAGDPAYFASARVHLGGMGFVSAYLIEAVDEFYCGLVKRVRVLPSDWYDRIATGDFAGAMGDVASGRTPHYYELTFDPFGGEAQEVCETIWLDIDSAGKRHDLGRQVEHHTLDAIAKVGAKGLHEVPQSELVTDNPLPAEDFEGRIRDLIDVPERILEDFRENAVCDDADVPRTLSQLTAVWKPHVLMGFRVDVYNAAFAVPRERLAEVMRIARTMACGENSIRQFSKDFVYTVRFAKKSEAGMGFLRFEDNAIINIDGLPANFLLGSDAPAAAVHLQHLLEKAGVPFAMHWGKDAQMNAAAIRRQYGDAAVEAYRGARKAILGASAKAFVSPALEHWGLQSD
ncbi:hypothetical protein K3148_06310 [Qipengyuania aurantiaca]|uniref:FAD-binding protein n=1 Tax=Qipengyuania aurantiaca TaxID=2867233 RepID=A0ABX8ZPN8_9SPHN|nr:hypothetical protein [Qipengyuania aurantiaca]QZD90992.1 hypothetical protein K3148_06310 [Qipengyuania aurantiaca]